ncbi:hypothetical protein WME76_45715 (plasmid) [Sorangium sp. So ce119]|uniref:hypothetical protein n=1 Tax=Sorangium sp. So ce119 TaxID=3133279 RepID=UPI003F625658
MVTSDLSQDRARQGSEVPEGAHDLVDEQVCAVRRLHEPVDRGARECHVERGFGQGLWVLARRGDHREQAVGGGPRRVGGRYGS